MHVSAFSKGELSAIRKFKDRIIMLHLLLQDQVSFVHLSSAASLGGLTYKTHSKPVKVTAAVPGDAAVYHCP